MPIFRYTKSMKEKISTLSKFNKGFAIEMELSGLRGPE
jgi:hypothetical protein